MIIRRSKGYPSKSMLAETVINVEYFQNESHFSS